MLRKRPALRASPAKTEYRLARGIGAAAGAALLASLVLDCAWVPATHQATRRPSKALTRQHRVPRRAGEVFVPDASPKGKAVIDAYKKLVDAKGTDEAAGIMRDLDADQRKMLKGLIEARGGGEAAITTTEPELGDTPMRLYRKLQMLKDDAAVLAWRKKLEPSIAQAVQLIIEAEQMKLADAEAEEDLNDAEEAQVAYEMFQAQFPKPAENEKYFTTPCRVPDIKYRFRRLKEHLALDSMEALAIIDKDASPLVVDPDYIRRTWKAMLEECGSREDALEALVKKHPGSLIASPEKLRSQIGQMKMAAFLIDATSGVSRFLRGAIADNGRRTFINARDEPAFGGGFPAWKRKWEEERAKEEMERSST